MLDLRFVLASTRRGQIASFLPMSPLQKILAKYRATSQSEREKGNYFEELICTYFRFEASYADLYSDVWLYTDWAKSQGLDGKDTGIDLVAKTAGTGEFHAIQCKCYAEAHKIRCAQQVTGANFADRIHRHRP